MVTEPARTCQRCLWPMPRDGRCHRCSWQVGTPVGPDGPWWVCSRCKTSAPKPQPFFCPTCDNPLGAQRSVGSSSSSRPRWVPSDMRWLARIVVLALIAALALAVLPRLTSDVGGPLNVLLTLWVGVTLSVWVLVAVAAGWLAEEKGRSPVIWFLIGLLSGPFAVLLAGFAPRGASGDYRRCKDCREPIRREAVVCPFCRASMPTEVALD